MKRVNKRVAKKLYKDGVDIFMLPRKVNPHNIYGIGSTHNINNYHISVQGDRSYQDFDYLVENITYYNCNNELGTYLAYYVEE